MCAIPVTKLRRTSLPRGVWTTSGWNWMPYRFGGRGRPGRRTGVDSVWAVAWKPSGRRVIESPWLIQTGCSRSRPANRSSSRVIWTVAGPYSRLRRGQDVAAQLEGHHLGAVADPEDGEPAAPDRGVGLGRALVVDRHRAAGQDDRADAAALQLGERRVVGEELGVDVQLADATRDQLRELGAEVQDGDDARLRDDGRDRRVAWGRGPGPARRARPRGRPRPRRRPARGPGGRRWPPRRGSSCRAARPGSPPSRPRGARVRRRRPNRPPGPPPARPMAPPRCPSRFAPVYLSPTRGDAKTGRQVVGSWRPVEAVGGGALRLFFSCSSVVRGDRAVPGSRGPQALRRCRFDGRILRPSARRTHRRWWCLPRDT